MGGPLEKYRYRSTVLKLNASDAARLGLTEEDLVDPPATAPGGEGEATSNPPAATKARPVASNKARTSAPAKTAPKRKTPQTADSDGDTNSGEDGGGGGD
ncbi:hypothetical protein ACFQ61_10070 [Streptomyces sp. NPDC056500]|uniref:hypothetical protein n=1 Tax=Streptomyces sp. NPDC056500 TaxID=3345840 RepID=UPI0036C1D01C